MSDVTTAPETTTTTDATSTAAPDATQSIAPQAAAPSSASEGAYAGLVNPDGSFADNWADKLPADMQDYAGTAARFTSLPNTIKSYREAQQELGRFKERSVVYPREGDNDATIGAYREAVGAPIKAEEYGLSKAPVGVEQWDAEYGKRAEAILHKYHVPAAAAQELAALEVGRYQQQQQLQQNAEAQFQSDVEKSLREAWGDDYSKNRERAEHVAKVFGVDPADMDVSSILKAFSQLANQVERDPTLQRQTGITPDSLNNLGLSNPRSQALDIVNNKQNALHAAYHGHQGLQAQKEARDTFHRLINQASNN